jgi:hypothetical protein
VLIIAHAMLCVAAPQVNGDAPSALSQEAENLLYLCDFAFLQYVTTRIQTAQIAMLYDEADALSSIANAVCSFNN